MELSHVNIFIDGTWNTPKDESNIYRMYQIYRGDYYTGPGTTAVIGDTPIISKWLGGIFGFGTQAIVDTAYKNLSSIEDVNILGFSRGAYAARVLAGTICRNGGSVNFLGCFDTVGAMGIPVDIGPFKFQQINLFSDAHVHPNVRNAAHIMALDDPRPAFTPTPMEQRKGITQISATGKHWDIGSSDRTLTWMIRQFEKVRM